MLDEPSVSDTTRRAIEADGARLLLQFFHHFDARRYEEAADLFQADGVWNRQGKALLGPAAVLAAMQDRPATLKTRHVVTNLLVTPSGDADAGFALYLTAYMHDPGMADTKAHTIPGPSLLLFVPGAISLTTAGWRIRHMTMQRDFVINPQYRA